MPHSFVADHNLHQIALFPAAASLSLLAAILPTNSPVNPLLAIDPKSLDLKSVGCYRSEPSGWLMPLSPRLRFAHQPELANPAPGFPEVLSTFNWQPPRPLELCADLGSRWLSPIQLSAAHRRRPQPRPSSVG